MTALAWQWAKGVSSPIIGGDDIAYLEEPYIPHRIVGAVDHNLADGVMLLDEKK